ncbi:unnamed protein product [Caenorhabditis sp. 36 PRJEB53466]|nr:unnamed protein product [Caenorhabditis sp. 36 PRJEB53466]
MLCSSAFKSTAPPSRTTSGGGACGLKTSTMGFQNLWFSHPRKFGPGSRSCRVCAGHHGLIRKYGLDLCRRCFREQAKDIGFKKLD